MKPLLPWLQVNWDHLNRYIQQKRIPQALLITGHQGLGKQHLASQFACSLLCTQRQANGLSCGYCNSCLLQAAETHPDLIHIHPEEPGKAISIDQIRSLISKLTLKPQFEAYRVVIINPAEQMTRPAANAFLKCLEEPTERTVLLLITDKPSKLPATIISRCQKLTIPTPDKNVAVNWLKQQTVQDDPEILLSLAQGAPLMSLQNSTNGTLTLRNQCFNAWLSLAKQQGSPVVIAESWQKLPEFSLIVFWMTSWTIDLIKCVYSLQTQNLYNPDLNSALKALSQQLELKGLYQLYDLLLLSRQRLDTPINKQLLLEEILIQWSELNRSS